MVKTEQVEEFNALCARCMRSCRQPLGTKLLECPRFAPRPFKIEPSPKKQLDLFKF